MSEKFLEVGDQLVESQYGYYKSISTITRVTAKQAIIEKENAYTGKTYEIRFKRDTYSNAIGDSGYGASYYQFGTPDLIDKAYNEIRSKNLVNKVSKLNFANLSIEQLEKIIDIVEGE